jgi:Xaa-Pro dipeptidase
VPLHFTKQEFATRRLATRQAMKERGLEALLMFRQESMYYLTGFDTFGYVFFQCLVLTAEGAMTLLTRAPDLLQARHTSDIEDVRVWVDADGATPAHELRRIIEEHGLGGRQIGIELEAYGLTGRSWEGLRQVLEGCCTWNDASDLVSRLRLIKSEAELAYVQRAAELADEALEAARQTARAGAQEGHILAAMQGAVFQGGGDYPANRFIIGSGPGALMCRYFTGRRQLADDDQLTLEFAGVWRHYHACLMRTIRVGEPPPEQRRMAEACAEALQAAQAAVGPGRAMAEVFAAQAESLDAAGFKAQRLNACGYSLGATFEPNWMDWPMFYAGNPVAMAPNMVFFLHMILFDQEAGLAATLGETVLVTEDGCRRLSRAPLDLIVN